MTFIIDTQQLKAIIDMKHWDRLLELVKPKHFVRQEAGYVQNNILSVYQLMDNFIMLTLQGIT